MGFGEGGVLTEAVRQRPYSVVLLDECEKADHEVLNIFYQVFDKGMLADGEGRVIDFKNTVIILTSNLATDLITSAAMPGSRQPPLEDVISLVKPTLSAHFKPALLARMTVVPLLSDRHRGAPRDRRSMKLGAVVQAREGGARHRPRRRPKVYEAIADRCKEVESGARNVDHILRGTILPLVSSEILTRMAAGERSSDMRLLVSRRTAPSSAPRERDDVFRRAPRSCVSLAIAAGLAVGGLGLACSQLRAGHRPAPQVVHAADRRR